MSKTKSWIMDRMEWWLENNHHSFYLDYKERRNESNRKN